MTRKALARIGALVVVGLFSSFPALGSERTFQLRYTAKIAAPPKGEPLDLFLPLPAQTDAQEVISLKVEGPLQGVVGTEPRFGNRFWHGIPISATPSSAASPPIACSSARAAICCCPA